MITDADKPLGGSALNLSEHTLVFFSKSNCDPLKPAARPRFGAHGTVAAGGSKSEGVQLACREQKF
jgi:hypothetical protein